MWRKLSPSPRPDRQCPLVPFGPIRKLWSNNVDQLDDDNYYNEILASVSQINLSKVFLAHIATEQLNITNKMVGLKQRNNFI